jgi:ferrous iron transport protein B
LGNPNTGKTSLFNALTGLSQKVGNFPGVTVERHVGRIKLGTHTAQIIDLPGTYGLYPKSEDERIASQALQNPTDPDYPDTVLVVADANNLKPSLLLCTQSIDLGFRTVLVLNMADQLERRGAAVNEIALSQLLGIPVVLISALQQTGIEALKKILSAPFPRPAQNLFRIPFGLQAFVDRIRIAYNLNTDYAAYKMLLERNDEAFVKLRAEAGITQPQELIANELLVRYDRVSDLLAEAFQPARQQAVRLSTRLDAVLLHPLWGYVILVVILLLIFQAIFTWASLPMDLLDGGMAALGRGVAALLPDGWFKELLVGGIIAGIQGIVVFIPQIALLFLFIALLEESGYMSRVVFLMDRLMRPLGLSGKSVVPLLGGFACAVPSIMGARTIPNAKERLITIMITPLMSCSARIPVYTVLIAIFIPPMQLWGLLDFRAVVMAGFYFLGIVAAVVVSLLFKQALKYRNEGLFLTELPNYRMPRWRNVGIDIYNKAGAFVFQAGKVILLIGVLLWFLASFGPSERMAEVERKYEALKSDTTLAPQIRQDIDARHAAEKLQTSWAGQLGRAFEPVIRPLGYDWKIGIALISSFAAREVFVGTMNTLYALGDAGTETATDAGYGRLSSRLRSEKRADGTAVYTPAVALSLLVFYALAMQCMSTLAVVRRETGGWKWALVMLLYQSALAYLAALATYQIFA